MLKIVGVSKTYIAGGGKDRENSLLPTLNNISLSISKGEFVSIIGPSGCGKSTLFNLISGLEQPDQGRILLQDQDIIGEKGHVSYMMQKDLLLPWRTILDNCILGLELRQIPKAEARKKAMQMLQEFNLEKFASSYPPHLSGGMRQRVAFLRTMLADKEILLLDEPFGALDALTKSEMHDWLAQICQKYHPTVLFITHDVEEALFLSDRIYVLSSRPADVKTELKVDFPRPRQRRILVDQQFIKMKKELLEALFA